MPSVAELALNASRHTWLNTWLNAWLNPWLNPWLNTWLNPWLNPWPNIWARAHAAVATPSALAPCSPIGRRAQCALWQRCGQHARQLRAIARPRTLGWCSRSLAQPAAFSAGRPDDA
jgi:hypothetical protein